MADSEADGLEDIKREYLNFEFENKVFDVHAHEIVGFSKTCGETAPRFTDPTDPDFQAPPTFASCFARGRNLPDGFPSFGGIAMDGGKDVVVHLPIRPGVPLTGRSFVQEIYSKTGRSGRMIFVVARMELSNPQGEPVATADTRLVIREKIKS